MLKGDPSSLLFDQKEVILRSKSDEPYRLTPFIVTFCEGTLTYIDIKTFIEIGLKIVRFTMSRVTTTDKLKMLAMLDDAVKSYCEKYNVTAWPIAISVDIPNACIRTGLLSEEINDAHLILKENMIIELTSNANYKTKCDSKRIYMDDPYTVKKITPGTEISIRFGQIVLICTELIDSETIVCKVIRGGTMGSEAFVCIRGIKLERPPLLETDMELLMFARKFKVDIVTLNSIRYARTVKRTREFLKSEAYNPLIISTICEQEGLDNFDEILKASDAIILAREFLASNIVNKHQMIAIQLKLSAKCHQMGKPFFISGNILEDTMLKGVISNCDLNDITNAVLQGAGFVLKNYKDPTNLVKTINILDSVCRAVEPLSKTNDFWRLSNEFKIPVNAAEASILACALMAQQTQSLVVIIPTVTGRTAVHLSRVAPQAIILTVSTNPVIARQLQLYRGIVAIIYDNKPLSDWYDEMSARVQFAVRFGIKHDLLKYGCTYICLKKSTPTSSFCDNISLWKVVTEETEKHSKTEVIFRSPFEHRRSPIFVTLSNPNTTLVDIQKLMEAGINLIRFKMSHITKEDKIQLLAKVDKAAKMLSQKHGTSDWPVATAVELKTCIMKTGILQNQQEYLHLKEGTTVTLTCDVEDYNACTNQYIFVDNPYLTTDVNVEAEISIDQDEIILQCKMVLNEKSMKCIVTKSGKLGNLCQVCIRGGQHTQPYVTQKDLRIVQFAMEYQVDMIIVNYSRHADSIKKIKEFIGCKIKKPIIIAGICTREGLENIDGLIRESDGIMLSREYLAYELTGALSYKMNQIQKFVGAKCLKLKIPTNAAEAAALACVALANHTNAGAIILPTVSGRTAKSLLWIRPNCVVITVSNKTSTIRLLSTYRCVVSLMYNDTPHTNWSIEMERRTNFALEHAVKKGWLRFKDIYIILQKYSDVSSFCDVIKVSSVNIYKKTMVECDDYEAI
uniref:Pyruvate kinase n=1 Tax=Bombyx mori TaxID=7091 RepID=A0A8R2DPY2_BOMMO|nr:pyruvate kinase isoform X3 [Bombyx mori]